MVALSALKYVCFVLTACIVMAFVSGFAKGIIKYYRNGGLD